MAHRHPGVRRVSVVVIGLILACSGLMLAKSVQYEGSSCDLPNGAGKGVCRYPSGCQLYLSAVSRKDWVLCSSIERNQLVCCGDPRTNNSSRDLSLWRTQRNCSYNSLTNHILGGRETNSFEFMYMAALGYPTDAIRPVEFRCGASLITLEFLLTAAHCNTSDGPVMARMGVKELYDYKPNDPPIDIAIAKVFIHPSFRNRPKEGDIALLKLEHAVYDDFLKPICIYTELTDPAPAVNLTIAGWGSTDNDGTSSDVLLKATVSMWDRNVCKERLARNRMWPWSRFALGDDQLCAMYASDGGEPLADTCRGDSGGPLELVRNKERFLVGVTSAGWGCGTWNMPGLYTRVAYYVGWIDLIVSEFST